jgi:hypothetical protein
MNDDLVGYNTPSNYWRQDSRTIPFNSPQVNILA